MAQCEILFLSVETIKQNPLREKNNKAVYFCSWTFNIKKEYNLAPACVCVSEWISTRCGSAVRGCKRSHCGPSQFFFFFFFFYSLTKDLGCKEDCQVQTVRAIPWWSAWLYVFISLYLTPVWTRGWFNRDANNLPFHLQTRTILSFVP